MHTFFAYAGIAAFFTVIVTAFPCAYRSSDNHAGCEVHVEDPALLQLSSQKLSKDESSQTACTAAGKDPYSTGRKVNCCSGLVMCLGEWKAQGTFSFLCARACNISQYNAKFDTTPDYLNIAARAAGLNGNAGSIADNYYMVLGDIGGCGDSCLQCCEMQKAVAQKMNVYVAQKQSANPNSKLLFVLLVGDNMYWTGASTGRFNATWYSVYGPVLTSVPWFVIMGNHDFGNSDPEMACPFISPRFVCNDTNKNSVACGGTAPYSAGIQSYASNALNVDKGGVDAKVPNRQNWFQPDFFFYYSIPALDFELIGLDTNWFCRECLGGNGYGYNGGAQLLARRCGGKANLLNTLALLKNGSFDLLRKRATAAASKNVAIFSHYPDSYQGGVNLRQQFMSDMPIEKQNTTKVFNFFGHDHAQRCNGNSSTGECVDFLTGGSGGCCSTSDVPAGFVALSFDGNGYQKVDCFLDAPCTLNSYFQKSVVTYSSQQDTCRHTNDDKMCPNFYKPK